MAFAATISKNAGGVGPTDNFGANRIETSGEVNAGSVKIEGTQLIGGMGRVFRGSAAAAEVVTAGAGTYTAAQILTGTILRECTGGSRTDTLPTATLLVAAITAWTPAIGDCIDFLVSNTSDPVTEIITLAAGTDGAFAASQSDVSKTVLGTSSRLVRIRLTGVATPGYVVYV